MSEEYTPDIVSVIDEEGKEHVFEALDRIETDTGKYIALIPLPENPGADDEEADEFIVLKVSEGDGDNATLYPIEDEEELDTIGILFLERLAEKFAEDSED